MIKTKSAAQLEKEQQIKVDGKPKSMAALKRQEAAKLKEMEESAEGDDPPAEGMN